MIAGMTVSKLAISLPKSLVERARGAVREGRAKSVSGYIAYAIEETSKLDDLEAMLEDMLAESGGPTTAAERLAADEVLGITAPTRPKAKRR
jgi:Arc/MetJ-type ribon-helix-helix transcriptional regulator